MVLFRIISYTQKINELIFFYKKYKNFYLMELNNLDYSELDLAIEQALNSSIKKSLNDED